MPAALLSLSGFPVTPHWCETLSAPKAQLTKPASALRPALTRELFKCAS